MQGFRGDARPWMATYEDDGVGDGRNARIAWKNSIFRADHNLNGHSFNGMSPRVLFDYLETRSIR